MKNFILGSMAVLIVILILAVIGYEDWARSHSYPIDDTDTSLLQPCDQRCPECGRLCVMKRVGNIHICRNLRHAQWSSADAESDEELESEFE